MDSKCRQSLKVNFKGVSTINRVQARVFRAESLARLQVAGGPVRSGQGNGERGIILECDGRHLKARVSQESTSQGQQSRGTQDEPGQIANEAEVVSEKASFNAMGKGGLARKMTYK